MRRASDSKGLTSIIPNAEVLTSVSEMPVKPRDHKRFSHKVAPIIEQSQHQRTDTPQNVADNARWGMQTPTKTHTSTQDQSCDLQVNLRNIFNSLSPTASPQFHYPPRVPGLRIVRYESEGISQFRRLHNSSALSSAYLVNGSDEFRADGETHHNSVGVSPTLSPRVKRFKTESQRDSSTFSATSTPEVFSMWQKARLTKASIVLGGNNNQYSNHSIEAMKPLQPVPHSLQNLVNPLIIRKEHNLENEEGSTVEKDSLSRFLNSASLQGDIYAMSEGYTSEPTVYAFPVVADCVPGINGDSISRDLGAYFHTLFTLRQSRISIARELAELRKGSRVPGTNANRKVPSVLSRAKTTGNLATQIYVSHRESVKERQLKSLELADSLKISTILREICERLKTVIPTDENGNARITSQTRSFLSLVMPAIGNPKIIEAVICPGGIIAVLLEVGLCCVLAADYRAEKNQRMNLQDTDSEIFSAEEDAQNVTISDPLNDSKTPFSFNDDDIFCENPKKPQLSMKFVGIINNLDIPHELVRSIEYDRSAGRLYKLTVCSDDFSRVLCASIGVDKLYDLKRSSLQKESEFLHLIKQMQTHDCVEIPSPGRLQLACLPKYCPFEPHFESENIKYPGFVEFQEHLPWVVTSSVYAPSIPADDTEYCSSFTDKVTKALLELTSKQFEDENYTFRGGKRFRENSSETEDEQNVPKETASALESKNKLVWSAVMYPPKVFEKLTSYQSANKLLFFDVTLEKCDSVGQCIGVYKVWPAPPACKTENHRPMLSLFSYSNVQIRELCVSNQYAIAILSVKETDNGTHWPIAVFQLDDRMDSDSVRLVAYIDLKTQYKTDGIEHAELSAQNILILKLVGADIIVLNIEDFVIQARPSERYCAPLIKWIPGTREVNLGNFMVLYRKGLLMTGSKSGKGDNIRVCPLIHLADSARRGFLLKHLSSTTVSDEYGGEHKEGANSKHIGLSQHSQIDDNHEANNDVNHLRIMHSFECKGIHYTSAFISMSSEVVIESNRESVTHTRLKDTRLPFKSISLTDYSLSQSVPESPGVFLPDPENFMVIGGNENSFDRIAHFNSNHSKLQTPSRRTPIISPSRRRILPTIESLNLVNRLKTVPLTPSDIGVSLRVTGDVNCVSFDNVEIAKDISSVDVDSGSSKSFKSLERYHHCDKTPKNLFAESTFVSHLTPKLISGKKQVESKRDSNAKPPQVREKHAKARHPLPPNPATRVFARAAETSSLNVRNRKSKPVYVTNSPISLLPHSDKDHKAHEHLEKSPLDITEFTENDEFEVVQSQTQVGSISQSQRTKIQPPSLSDISDSDDDESSEDTSKLSDNNNPRVIKGATSKDNTPLLSQNSLDSFSYSQHPVIRITRSFSQAGEVVSILPSQARIHDDKFSAEVEFDVSESNVSDKSDPRYQRLEDAPFCMSADQRWIILYDNSALELPSHPDALRLGRIDIVDVVFQKVIVSLEPISMKEKRGSDRTSFIHYVPDYILLDLVNITISSDNELPQNYVPTFDYQELPRIMILLSSSGGDVHLIST